MKANLLTLITCCLALAACSAPKKVVVAPLPPAPPPQLPTPGLMPIPDAPRYADWRDAPRTPGDWHWGREGALSVARYGDRSVAAKFSLTCDAAQRTITLRRSGTGAGTLPLTITTPDLRRLLDAKADTGALATSLPASDPLLDAMAFSRGRFMVEAPGTAPLYLPSWAEVSRVIEDCR